jgi:hypothetical protein
MDSRSIPHRCSSCLEADDQESEAERRRRRAQGHHVVLRRHQDDVPRVRLGSRREGDPEVARSGVLASGIGGVSSPGIASERETGRLTLQKTVITRSYGSTQVEGEQRTIGPGDSLWRILIQEKALSERRFSQYLNLVRALNPQIKRLDVLKVGDGLFVPLNPDEALGLELAANKGTTESSPPRPAAMREYRVKRGDALYLILRRELRITSDRELTLYMALLNDLNPQKKNWDILREGEILRLPAIDTTATKTGKGLKPSDPLRLGEGEAAGPFQQPADRA